MLDYRLGLRSASKPVAALHVVSGKGAVNPNENLHPDGPPGHALLK